MNHQDHYHYKLTRGTVYTVQPMEWRRLDDTPAGPPSLLETLTGQAALPTTFSTNPTEVDTFFNDQLSQDRFGLDLLTCQLTERENIKGRHLEEIEESIAYCKGQIMHLWTFYPGTNRGIDQRRLTFSRQIQELEHQQRQEETQAWKDQAMLLSDFLEKWDKYKGDLWTYSFFNQK
ncbi:MAG: hypothetical protein HDKAJFGB_02318 [Anaerolineae bacterium]|nr:hypothetical protein [Anaerolineae bacterium]